MLEELQRNLEQVAKPICTESALVIADDIAMDIRSIVDEELQLSDPSQIGSALEPVIPQEGFRIRQLNIMGRARPETPRWNTGLMVSSVSAHPNGDMAALVNMGGFDEDIAIGQQRGNPGYKWGGKFYGPIPARPFFGVSARALDKVKVEVEATAARIVNAVEKMPLQPITITI